VNDQNCAVCVQKLCLLNLMAMYHLSFLAFITWQHDKIPVLINLCIIYIKLLSKLCKNQHFKVVRMCHRIRSNSNHYVCGYFELVHTYCLHAVLEQMLANYNR
jgi:hypothetical protein